MQVSHPHPQGHVVMCDLPANARVVALFADSSKCDVTDWAADLILWGLASADRPSEGETAQAGHVLVEGADIDECGWWYADPLSGNTDVIDSDAALEALAKGVAAAVSQGIELEAAP